MTTQRKRRTTIRSQASDPITPPTTPSIPGLPDVDRGHVPLGSLYPNPFNPRVIDDQEAAGLCKSIERFGLVQEIVVNRRSGQIVGGHQRVQALRAKDLPNHTLVPVAWVDLDEHDEEALNVALNNPAIQGHYTGDVRGILERLKTERPVVVDELRLDAVLADLLGTLPEFLNYTSTERDGQTYGSTMAVMGRAASDLFEITLGDAIVKVSQEHGLRLMAHLRGRFDAGQPYRTTLEGIIDASCSH